MIVFLSLVLLLLWCNGIDNGKEKRRAEDATASLCHRASHDCVGSSTVIFGCAIIVIIVLIVIIVILLV